MYTLVCEFYSGDMDARQTICLPVSSEWGTPHQYLKFLLTTSTGDVFKQLPHLEALWPISVFDLSSWGSNNVPERLATLGHLFGWYDDDGFHTFGEDSVDTDLFLSWDTEK